MTNRVVSPGPHLITTAPTLTKCRRCSQPVLAATVGGLDRHVGTATLNPTGELAALISGRVTYHLVTEDYLVRRTVEHIQAGPARKPVLADHVCAPTPEAHIDQAWTLAATALCIRLLGVTVPTDVGATPPF